MSLEQLEGLLGPKRGSIIREAEETYRDAFLDDLGKPGPMGVRVPDVLVWDNVPEATLRTHLSNERAKREQEQVAKEAQQSPKTQAAHTAPRLGEIAVN